MKNLDIRLAVSDSGLTYRELAAEMGISACHLSRLMGHDLKPANRERILAAIDKLQREKR